MQSFTIQQQVGNTDIYLLDQVIKGRYRADDIVLDAGCGIGRNLHWFLLNQISCYGIDLDEAAIHQLKLAWPFLPENRFQISAVENLPFEDRFFDHVISSAVLHFANSHSQFKKMIGEMIRVLKPGGSLFIRMTSNIGIEDAVESIGDGVFAIPDGSIRFLLTRPLLTKIIRDYRLILLEPVKTVNVDDIRCMTTLVLQKGVSSEVPVE